MLQTRVMSCLLDWALLDAADLIKKHKEVDDVLCGCLICESCNKESRDATLCLICKMPAQSPFPIVLKGFPLPSGLPPELIKFKK